MKLIIIGLLGVLLYVLILHGLKLEDIYRHKKVQWKPVDGTVVSSVLQVRLNTLYLKIPVTQYKPEICYKYTYGGQEYTGCSKWGYLKSKKVQQQIVDNYTQGQQIKIQVNSDSPHESYLSKSNINTTPVWIQTINLILVALLVWYVLSR